MVLTLYEWYSFKYGDPKASLGRGIQEGDHFSLHLEAPEITWESGSKNPPSITVLNGKMIGAEKAFSEAVAWNPGSHYKKTDVYNLEMTKSGDRCDPDKDL